MIFCLFGKECQTYIKLDSNLTVKYDGDWYDQRYDFR